MTGGYMGKILFVDLSTGEIKEEALDEKICRDFIGGYGTAEVVGAGAVASNRSDPAVGPHADNQVNLCGMESPDRLATLAHHRIKHFSGMDPVPEIIAVIR